VTAYVPTLLSLLVVDLLAAISPGPNFVVVTQTALARAPTHAFAVVFGIVTANLIWCAAVALGLSALFGMAPWLYGGLRLVGGGYLIYLGLRLWLGESRPTSPRRPAAESSRLKAYARGLLTNLTNPKSAVYFGSVFTLFMGPNTPAWVQVAAIGIVVFDTVLWYGTVAALFSRESVRRLYAAVRRPVDRAAGAVMVVFGARLVLLRD
jgi:RhtB (resistance to homoserine/threonine) family protein